VALGALLDFLGGKDVVGQSTLQTIADLGNGVGKLFLSMLKMLVVPLIMSSLITGVVGVPSMRGLRRMSGWTFGYYLMTSVIAITLGIMVVNVVQPGSGVSYDKLAAAAQSDGKAPPAGAAKAEKEGLSVLGKVLQRMVPENVVQAASSNTTILSIIFFSLMLGIFIKRTGGEHGEVLAKFFEALFEVMMRMTSFVISLAPYGIFGAMIGFAAKGGLSVAGDLAMYMLTVAIALLIHGFVILPILLRVLAKRSPLQYARAMSPALLTAFSTASSNGTLPLTMRCAEERAGVPSRVTSFTLPLGATINMDGTALYEAIAVLFIAQTLGDLSLAQQVVVAVTALAASIGAAGIPHAGLVMMVIVLQAVNLPTDAVMIILAVDRLLDMGRTTINVWSDSCCAAVVAARTAQDALPDEGEAAVKTAS
jgi:Na+/H+-dicarboxylate symporter